MRGRAVKFFEALSIQWLIYVRYFNTITTQLYRKWTKLLIIFPVVLKMADPIVLRLAQTPISLRIAQSMAKIPFDCTVNGQTTYQLHCNANETGRGFTVPRMAEPPTSCIVLY